MTTVIRNSLALAIAVTSATPGLAADWSGFYGGLSTGGGFGQQGQRGGLLVLPSSGGKTAKAGTSASAPPPPPSSSSFSSSSISSCISSCSADGDYRLHSGLVGGAVGYNFQRERLVYGFALDGGWADISGSGTCGAGGGAPHACGGNITALGGARLHLGYDLLQPNIGPFQGAQAFIDGGLAVAKVRAYDSLFDTSGSRTITGWSFGGGLEALMTQHWSVSVEYLHVDLGQHGLFTAIQPNTEQIRTSAELFKVGLNYHFSPMGAFASAGH